MFRLVHTKILSCIVFILFLTNLLNAQTRINYNGRNLFLNGSNVAWINFAADIGPGNTNFTKFESIFKELHESGGNSFRLWLHTDGSRTPEFNSSGIVVGPGAGAIDDLKQILDLAWKYDVGLMLCLWSHDMMRNSLWSTMITRNKLLLTDTAAIRSYIAKALVPMVEGVKEHPAILAWEIFNEPEGFTEVGNWSDRVKVSEFDVQRFVNLTAGAIHRTDSTVKVTNGTWGMQAQTDVQALAKVSPESFFNSLTSEQKTNIEKTYEVKFGNHLSAEQIINKFYSPSAANYNYYKDDRLIAAGGDPDGKLDFYTVHYYNWAGTALSPFHHSYSSWNLDKPLAVAEFFMEDTFGVPYDQLYLQLYNTGYAGALSWQWWGDTAENDGAKNQNHSRTSETLEYMFKNYRNDILVKLLSGTIYDFSVSSNSVQQGDSVIVSWDTEAGSNVIINGQSFDIKGSKIYKLDQTTTFDIVTSGENPSTKSITVEFIPPGKVISFKVLPYIISLGDTVEVSWQTSKGSTVTLNGVSVPIAGSMTVVPDNKNSSFMIRTNGNDLNTRILNVVFLSADQINRALGGVFTSADTDTLIANNSISNLNDDFTTTRWTAVKSTSPKSILLDLGRNYNINKIEIDWGSTYTTGYQIISSANQLNWQTLILNLKSKGGLETFVDLKGYGRYVKMTFSLSSNTYYGISIDEFRLYGTQGLVDVNNEPPNIPVNYSLEQNYPNPFNPETIIKYQMPVGGHVLLKVFDILGKEVTTLVNEYKQPGIYSSQLSSGNFSLSSGVYFYKLIIEPMNGSRNFIVTKKMMLIK